ncbi:phosphatase PAP2 family protein [Bacillus daqingensis]|uniref:Phosphatase PAP2 family protein n=1 Tax=Bacillus daqingensis TaxID=872396 RepID=A0ABV9NYV8_9BACI
MSAVSAAGWFGSAEVTIATALLAAGVFLIYKKRRLAWYVMAYFFGGMLFTLLLKFLVQRERPGAERMIELFSFEFELESYSFPSGHAMRLFLLAGFLIWLLLHYCSSRVMRAGAGIFIFLAATAGSYSRVSDGWHYPSDIAGSAFAAVIFAMFFMLMTRRRIFENVSKTKNRLFVSPK